MPMDPANYPGNWKELSAYVRLKRAAQRCECIGQCGVFHLHGDHGKQIEVTRDVDGSGERCRRCNGDTTSSGGIVVLTAAHLCQESTCADPLHLLAMCQACHLAYDREQHAETRAKNIDKRRGQSRLPLEL